MVVLERERVFLAGGGEERWAVGLFEAAAREAFRDRVVTMRTDERMAMRKSREREREREARVRA